MYNIQETDFNNRDYKSKDMFELNYKRNIEDYDKYRGKCYFFNYASYVFNDIRRIFKIDNEEY